MLGAYGSLVGQAEIVEGSWTGSKYILALEFVLEAINCAIFLVVLVVLVLVVLLVLVTRF